MIWRQIETLMQRSKNSNHILQLYSLITKTSLHYDNYFISKFILSSSLISLDTTKLIFDKLPNTPSSFAFNILIREFSKSSKPIESLNFFKRVQQNGLKGDKFTYPFVVKACGSCFYVNFGGLVHSLIFKSSFDSDKYIAHSLISMYGCFRETTVMRKVFDEMFEKDVVSWSSLISGYVNCSYPLDALETFQLMKSENVDPNSVTLVSLLSACTTLLNISIGESIHSFIIINNIELDTALGTALLELYSKCGNLEKAFHVFNIMKEKNLQSWTIMISGFADHGRGEDALSLFTQMEKTGLKPDSISFSSILSACSHMGHVDEGKNYFEYMVSFYKIKPTIEHYGCMVDMLGRAGLIEEAYQVIKNMSIEPNSIILRSFISACKHHSHIVPLDDRLRKRLLEIEPDLGANYVVSASFSSLSDNWNDAADMRIAMKDRGLKKVPGRSWVKTRVKTRVKTENDFCNPNWKSERSSFGY